MKNNEKFNSCKYCNNNKNIDKCYQCDGNISFQNKKNYLQMQTIIKNNYIIDKLISFNSEGATYLAYDIQLNNKYFIREYMPIGLSKRDSDNINILPLHEKEAQYKALIVDFIDLHKTLLSLSSTPGIIPIKEIFLENNSAYVIKKYSELISFNNYLDCYPNHFLSWYKCKPIFLKINSTLSKVHRYGLIHRGISPYNIFFDKLGNVYIDEFSISCVRTAHSELKAELFDSYSAPEQYQTNGWQGTWTDVYGLAATLYSVLTGQKLPPIKDRTDDNHLLLEKNKLTMPKEIAITIIKAIKSNHRDRTQTIDQFNLELIGEDSPNNTAIYDTSNLKKSHFKKGSDKMKKKKNIIIITILLFIIIFAIIICINIFKNITSSNMEKIDEKYIEKNPWLFDETSNSETENIDKSLGKSNISSLNNQINLTTLPNFVGEQINVIKSNQLYTKKLNFIIEEEFSESNEGEIIHQEPLPGSSLKNSKLDVILKVSRGPEYVEVPDLIGKPINDSETLLKKLQIKYEIVEVYDKNYKKNVINIMNKNPGDKIIKNKEVLILRIRSSQLSDVPTPVTPKEPSITSNSSSSNSSTSPSQQVNEDISHISEQ